MFDSQQLFCGPQNQQVFSSFRGVLVHLRGHFEVRGAEGEPARVCRLVPALVPG